MRTEELKGVCLKSADDMLSYCELFGAGESVIGVRRYVLSGRGHLVLSLESPVTDTSGIYLRVGDDVFDSSCIVFPFCDPRSRTLGVLFTQGNYRLGIQLPAAVSSDIKSMSRSPSLCASDIIG